MLRFRRARGPLDLAVDMASVRMGERLLQVGVGDPRLFAVTASKVGLTGRAVAVVDAPAAAAVLEAAAADEGVLVEVVVAEAGAWPVDAGSFDIVIVDANAVLAAAPDARVARLTSAVRALRPGGRLLAVLRRGRSLAVRLGFEPEHRPPTPEAATLVAALAAAGCPAARVLAEREGLGFIEALRPGATAVHREST